MKRWEGFLQKQDMAGTRGDLKSRISDKILTSRNWSRTWPRFTSFQSWLCHLAVLLQATYITSWGPSSLIRKIGIIIYTFRIVLTISETIHVKYFDKCTIFQNLFLSLQPDYLSSHRLKWQWIIRSPNSTPKCENLFTQPERSGLQKTHHHGL